MTKDKGEEWGEIFASDARQNFVKYGPDQPRWDHTSPYLKHPAAKKRTIEFQFLMQYKEFDIYIYPNHFVLRWGRDPYRRAVPYDKIKEADEPRFEIPEGIQMAILAGRAMIFDTVTK